MISYAIIKVFHQISSTIHDENFSFTLSSLSFYMSLGAILAYLVFNEHSF